MSIANRAEELLEAFRPVVPFQAARIYLLDQERRAQRSLISHGYDEAVSAYSIPTEAARDLIGALAPRIGAAVPATGFVGYG